MSNVLFNTINSLNYLVSSVPEMIRKIPDEEFNSRPAKNKWSKKEILGHLIDSAANNHQRFVRVQFEKQPYKIIKYAQNEWVSLQDYFNEDRNDVLNLWTSYNKHLIHIIKNTPNENLALQCVISPVKTESLLWLIEDYLSHLEHHLKQILGELFSKSSPDYVSNE